MVKKTVVEVKIAHKWSLAALDQGLQDQLVGKYLGDAKCKAGCLLVTYHGKPKQWTHPDTRKRISFPEAVAYLKEKAQNIENESPSEFRVAAFGLDLTDPDTRR